LELQNIYSATYLYPVHKLIIGEKKYRAQGTARFVRQILSGRKRLRILEAGCMYGYLLEVLKDEHEVSGIEIGEEPVKHCIEKGLNVKDISVESFLEQENGQYDVIILSHVLEHLTDPAAVLSGLSGLLSPGGMLVICVPNHRSFTRKVFGRYWGWWQVPVHLNHFNQESLNAIAGKSGLSVIQSRVRGGDSLMLLINFMNLFGSGKKSQSIGCIKTTIIRINTALFRYWYRISNEEIAVAMKKTK
jgi:SAM-dependent methyltransferase